MIRKNKVRNEQFYTKQEIALKLVNFIKSQDWFSTIERVIEPAAGAGAFSNLFDNCIAFDIEPAINVSNIIITNFLSIDIHIGLKTLVVGNPPFGKQSSLALKFIKKSCIFADYIAFILPLSFKKASYQNKIPATHSLIAEILIEPNSFYTSDKEDFKMSAVFQIWKRENRQIIKLKKNSDYFEWSDKEDANLAIRRVGYYAGNVIEDIKSTSIVSHYYIKCEEKKIKNIINCIKNIDWTKLTALVAGPRSLSKSEFVYEFENMWIKINDTM